MQDELIPVTASFGIAISSAELRPQQLLSQADQALYQAKAGGRNLVKAYAEPVPVRCRFLNGFSFFLKN